MEKEKSVKEKVEEIQLTKEQLMEKLVAEEKAAVREASRTNQMPEESIPPIMMEDEYGNIMAHALVKGKYVPKPTADVMAQEKKIIIEYQKLEDLKEIEEQYKTSGVKSLEVNN